ncbi:nuclear receptor subfamily 2 group C member 2-like isoform X2 [Nematostella vectensis]|nr:nuclear receptor subfamily 2 group C member 2-like isoform X2 [Nematostella vectensis]
MKKCVEVGMKFDGKRGRKSFITDEELVAERLAINEDRLVNVTVADVRSLTVPNRPAPVSPSTVVIKCEEDENSPMETLQALKQRVEQQANEHSNFPLNTHTPLNSHTQLNQQGIKHSDFHVSTQTPLHQQATEDSNYPSGTDFDTINPSNFSSTISESSHSASPYEELSTPNRPTISYVQQVSSSKRGEATVFTPMGQVAGESRPITRHPDTTTDTRHHSSPQTQQLMDNQHTPHFVFPVPSPNSRICVVAELAKAVEPIHFIVSENIQDAATRLLSASIRFARNVPCFTRLPFRDQIILLEEGWKELFLLDAAYWALPLEIASLLAVTGGCHSDSYRHKASEIKLLQELLARLRSFQMDLNELACLKAIVLFRPETKGLKDSDQVDKIQDHIQLLLAHHTMTKHPTHPSRFGKLLLSISPLHSLAEKPIEEVLFRKTDDKDIFESVLSQLMDNSC